MHSIVVRLQLAVANYKSHYFIVFISTVAAVNYIIHNCALFIYLPKLAEGPSFMATSLSPALLLPLLLPYWDCCCNCGCGCCPLDGENALGLGALTLGAFMTVATAELLSATESGGGSGCRCSRRWVAFAAGAALALGGVKLELFCASLAPTPPPVLAPALVPLAFLLRPSL
jgi:hypothetical protein